MSYGGKNLQNNVISNKIKLRVQWNDYNAIFYNQILAHCYNNLCSRELNSTLDSLSTLASNLKICKPNYLDYSHNRNKSYQYIEYKKVIYYLYNLYSNMFYSSFHSDLGAYTKIGHDLQQSMSINSFPTNSLNNFSICSSLIIPDRYIIKNGCAERQHLITKKNTAVIKIGGKNIELIDYKTIGNLNSMSLNLELLNTDILRIVFNFQNIVPIQLINL